jgi:hypothetical protein
MTRRQRKRWARERSIMRRQARWWIRAKTRGIPQRALDRIAYKWPHCTALHQRRHFNLIAKLSGKALLRSREPLHKTFVVRTKLRGLNASLNAVRLANL